MCIRDSTKAGELSAKSILFASDALKKNEIDTLVTLPINKNAIQSEIFKFKGHTDFFSKKFSGEALMFMVHDKLKVALVTEHIPIRLISNILTKALFNYIDSLGCSSIANIPVIVNPPPTVSSSATTSICLGGSVILTASGAVQYLSLIHI